MIARRAATMARRVAVLALLALEVAIAPAAPRAAETPDATARAADALAAGRYDEAASAAREALAAAGAGADATARGRAWQLLGAALAARGELRAAGEAWRQAAEADGEGALEARVGLATLGLYTADHTAALETLEDLLARYGNRVDSLDAGALHALASAAETLATRAPALFNRAVTLYQAAFSRAPDQLAARVALGDLLLRKHNNAEALELYRESLAIDEEYAPALLGLARSRYFDHLPGAAEAARESLRVQPTLVPARVLLARLLMEAQDYVGAAAELEQALETNPASLEALSLRAALHFLRDERPPLEAALAELAARVPHYAGAFNLLAEVAARARRYREAVAYAQAALEVDPRNWDALALLGTNQLRLGEMAPGRRALERAFAGDPYNVRVKNTLDLLDVLRDYAVQRSRRFVLVAEEGRAQVLAPYLLPLAEAAYDHYAERYDYRPQTPVRIEVFSRHADFSVRTVGLTGLDILGASFGPVVLLDTPAGSPFGAFNWGAALWHELAHTFHLGLSEHRVPRWFSEGLSVYEERRARPGWGADVSPDFLGAFHAGRLRPASELEQAFLQPRFPGEVAHSYYLASLLLELIEARHGVGALRDMLRGFAAGSSTEALVRERLGYQPAAFDAALAQYVRERFAGPLRALFAQEDDPEAGEYPRLLGEGRSALEAGELARAEALLLAAQALFPEHAGPNSTYHDLARLYHRRGELALAAAQLQRSISIDADDLEGHQLLAQLLRERQDGAQARDVLERSLYIQPFAHDTHSALAEHYEDAGDWQRARAARAAVLTLQPEDEIAARYYLARALSRAGEPVLARREVLRTLLEAPLYEDALELLLEIRAQLGADTASDPPSASGG